MRAMAAPALLFFSIAGAALPASAQRSPDPQAHEVKLDVDISIESQANGALIDALYTFTPARIDRNDVVVPTLRRFVRHPSALWVRGVRDGHTREPRTSIGVGGVLELGPAFAGGEIGAEYEEIAYDELEHGIFLLPFSVEVGARPVELLRLAAFYEGRPVVANRRHPRQPVQAERSGLDQRFGGRVGFATPSDRLLLEVSAWGRLADWTFEGFHPGEITIRGLGGEARVSFQLSATFSLALRGEVARDRWVNARAGDEAANFVGSDLERDVWSATGGVEVLYWFRGRHAFRFGVGGGYEGAPPTVNNRETAIAQLSLGIITRF